jgi:outer membrane protein OmpA-like peptidoglycan-associated protein
MNHTRWIRIKSGMGILLPFGLLLLFIAGCGPSQKEMMAKDQMDRAKKSYAEAKANPNVETYAPMQLQEAGKALQEAEKAKKTEDILQTGYVAERKTQFAVAIADGKVAEKEIDKLNVEKAEMNAKKQTLEAERSKQEAAKAMSDAEAAKREAAKAMSDAEAAKRDTEKAMSQAEEAKRDTAKAMSEAEVARTAAAVDAERAAMARRQAEEESAKAATAAIAATAAQAQAQEAERAKAETEQFIRELSDLGAKQTDRGVVLTLGGDVSFALGKASLSPAAARSVDKLAAFMKNYPKRSMLIEGYTDASGSEKSNLALSQKRADEVKQQLVAKGIEPARIAAKGYGKQYPVAGNDTAKGREQNRRVEVLLLKEGVQPETMIRQ